MGEIIVEIADMKTAANEETLVTYALGSCVGICLYDTGTKAGGMLHSMLPAVAEAYQATNPNKYTDSGILALYRALCRRGVFVQNLQAKLIGGAKMFEYRTMADALDIGTANVVQARKCLDKLHIPIVGEAVGGQAGRTVWFNLSDGGVVVKATDGTIEKL